MYLKGTTYLILSISARVINVSSEAYGCLLLLTTVTIRKADYKVILPVTLFEYHVDLGFITF